MISTLMRTAEQRREIYNIVKARLEKGMSGRSARANIDHNGKVFDLDFKTWKTYAAEFDGLLPGERTTSHPEPGRASTQSPATSIAPILLQTPAPAVPAFHRRGGRKPGVHKTRFLVALSDMRLDQLKAEATLKDKTSAALAVDYIIEGLDRAEKARKQGTQP